MPTATARKSTTAPRKTRTRKATTPRKKVSTTRRKSASKINTSPAKVQVDDVNEEAKVETKSVKSLLKDYPRDGFSLIILPLLYLEAAVKELLKLAQPVK